MKKNNSLQNNFLDELILMQTPVSIYLKNSIRLKGFLLEHNEEAVFLRQTKIHQVQMIYKQVISTINKELVFERFET